MWALIKYNHGARILYKLIHYIPDRIEHRERWVSAVQRTSIPVKLLAGMLDPVSGARMAARYRELIPNPNVTELAQGGHYPHIQVPEQVLGAYLPFRQEVEASVTARSGVRPAAARLS
jgi:pimeloyl-ACP methyl ester carboxylesterase